MGDSCAQNTMCTMGIDAKSPPLRKERWGFWCVTRQLLELLALLVLEQIPLLVLVLALVPQLALHLRLPLPLLDPERRP